VNQGDRGIIWGNGDIHRFLPAGENYPPTALTTLEPRAASGTKSASAVKMRFPRLGRDILVIPPDDRMLPFTCFCYPALPSCIGLRGFSVACANLSSTNQEFELDFNPTHTNAISL